MTPEQESILRMIRSRRRRVEDYATKTYKQAELEAAKIRNMAEEITDLLDKLEESLTAKDGMPSRVYLISEHTIAVIRAMVEREMSDGYIAKEVGYPASVVRKIINANYTF